MNLDKLKASLRKHEGVRHQPYRCTAGALTIGVGRNLDAKGLSSDEIEILLDRDIHDCIFDLGRERHGWRAHSSARQNVLIELAFNLGMPRLNLFVKMWQALEDRDYIKASEEMLSSHWAAQVGQRAVTLAQMMRNG